MMKMMKTNVNWRIILIWSAVVIAALGVTAFGVFHWESKNGAPATGAPGPASEQYTVQFATYTLAEGIPLTLEATSVERDLSIYILDDNSQPVTDTTFQVLATGPSGETTTYTDEDASGKIYVENLDPGDYTLALQDTGRFIAPEPMTVNVKDKVKPQVIANIDKKLVNSKNVDASSEDAAYGGHTSQPQSPVVTPTPTPTPPPAPPAPPADTVPYYDSKTITSQQDTTVPLLDDNGNQVVKYTPVTDNDGFLLNNDADGTSSQIIPVVGGDGYCDQTDPNVFDANGQPLTGSDGTSSMYQLVAVPQTTTETQTITTYQGWQTLNDKKYYFDKDGNPVTGTQTIQGVTYLFDTDGTLLKQVDSTTQTPAKPLTGVDVSTYQTGIDWKAVKNSGISFVMIRAGYRGYGTGVLVEDDMFKSHAAGAAAAGLKVGLYFYSQAINEKEAVEEASACVAIAQKYGVKVTYPIAIDIEYSTSSRPGRADWLTPQQRTKIATAFCDTIKSAGYTPMIYSSKSWFQNDSQLLTSQLAPKYKIWLAHWGVAQTDYPGRYDIWQYTSSGSVPGIPGRVDMNISYLG